MPKSRSKRGGWARFAPYARTAARVGKYALRMYSGTKRIRDGSGTGVTQQHDMQRQYRYKRMPKRKRMRFKRSARLFTSRLVSSLGTQQVIRNNSVNVTALVTGQQWVGVHLYGMSGTNTTQEIGCDDINSIRAADINVSDSGKMFFSNAILDLTVRNNATNVLELDMYVVRSRVKNRIFANYGAAVTNAIGDTGLIGATQITYTTRGATPFEFPDVCKYFKIYSKKKYFIGAGQCITAQFKDRKNRVITGDQINFNPLVNTENCFKDGWHMMVLFIGKAVTGTAESADYTVGATRSYRYKFLETNENRDGIL